MKRRVDQTWREGVHSLRQVGESARTSTGHGDDLSVFGRFFLNLTPGFVFVFVANPNISLLPKVSFF